MKRVAHKSEDSGGLTVEYSGLAMYRKRVLEKLHKTRMIEFDKKGARAHISPKGSAYVEDAIIGPSMGWN